MLVKSITTKTILYRTLQSLGLLFTDDYYVRKTRKEIYETRVSYLPISNADIYVPEESARTVVINGKEYKEVGQISYQNSHISIHKCNLIDYDRNNLEFWLGDQYIHPSECSWISTETYDHLILPDRYKEYLDELDEEGKPKRNVITMRQYSGVFKRYSVKAPVAGNLTHEATIDFSKGSATLVKNPYCCMFYYADGVLHVSRDNQVTRISDTMYRYTFNYSSTLDVYWCYNLVSTHDAEANTTFNLHAPEDEVCYPRIMVDHDETYPVDTLFYPAIRVDKDCIIRVFADNAISVPCPYASRLQLYPEHLAVTDPYTTDNEYLSWIRDVKGSCNVFITDDDDDETILEKFHDLAPYCYRLGEFFPRFADEQSDFLELDNHNWEEEYHEIKTITRLDGTTQEVILIAAPYEGYRDVLFYDGWIYSSYEVVRLNDLVETTTGQTYYVIQDTSLDLDKLTLLKFNTGEDTVINNLGEHITKDNLLDLHVRVNRLYRNLLVLKGQVQDAIGNEEEVYVSATEPVNVTEGAEWLEILSNIDPTDPPPNIFEYLGIDPANLPPDLAAALDSLGVDSENPNEVYYYIMMTYIVHEGEKRGLHINMPLPPGSLSHTYTSLPVSTLTENPLPNDVVIEVQNPTEADLVPITDYYVGDGEPITSTYDENDVYLNMPDAGLAYIDAEGNIITLAEIAALDVETKKKLVTDYITDGTDAQIAEVKAQWNEYLDGMNEDTLNAIVYMVLRTDYFARTYTSFGALTEEVVPKEEAIHRNLAIVISTLEPTDPSIATAWVDAPTITVQDYLNAGLLQYLYVNYPHLYDDVDLEALVDFLDASTHKVIYDKVPPVDPAHGDIWYEFLEDVHNKVCYADQYSLVLNINEQLTLVEFDNDNVTVFAFDDILMNFHGRSGIRYLTIAVDLLNSGVITKDQINVFYHRLITGTDEFDPGLQRLYSGRSHVIVTADVDTTDLSVLYSSNIGRLHIDYTDPTIGNKLRETAWRHIIDYRQADVAFIPDRMLLFVNGRLTPRSCYADGLVSYLENDVRIELPAAGMLQIIDFDEIIEYVDVLYSMKDVNLAKLKRIAVNCWHGTTPALPPIRTPVEAKYRRFHPIGVARATKKGFYDVLLDEYILNGRLLRSLGYLKDHPEEFEDFHKDLLNTFHAISDDAYINESYDLDHPDVMSRIIIPGFGTDQRYQVGSP